MYYETKFRHSILNEKGKTETKYVSYLVWAESFAEADFATQKHAIDDDYSIEDVVAIKCSKIREVANEKKEDDQAWVVTLSQLFVDDNGKEKQTRYPVLLWSKDTPSTQDGELKDYLKQIDPACNCFTVIAVKQSNIEKEL